MLRAQQARQAILDCKPRLPEETHPAAYPANPLSTAPELTARAAQRRAGHESRNAHTDIDSRRPLQQPRDLPENPSRSSVNSAAPVPTTASLPASCMATVESLVALWLSRLFHLTSRRDVRCFE